MEDGKERTYDEIYDSIMRGTLKLNKERTRPMHLVGRYIFPTRTEWSKFAQKMGYSRRVGKVTERLQNGELVYKNMTYYQKKEDAQ